jgi:P27 family predicted phage terminase small subunit
LAGIGAKIRRQLSEKEEAPCLARRQPRTSSNCSKEIRAKRRIGREPEPEIAADVPEPPSFLTGYAQDEWWRVAPELHRLKLLTVLDIGPLAAYCQAYGCWRTAGEALAAMAKRDEATSALLIKDVAGNARANPLVRIAARAADDMVSFAGHFGMSPAARARISAGVGYEPPGGGKFDGLIAG